MSYENAQRLTVSLSPTLAAYLDAYQRTHQLPSRSEAVAHAIRALREKELADAYADHARSGEFVDLENADGLQASDGSEWL